MTFLKTLVDFFKPYQKPESDDESDEFESVVKGILDDQAIEQVQRTDDQHRKALMRTYPEIVRDLWRD